MGDALDQPGCRDVDVSVVICAYTEQRWDDLCAAVRSVEAQRPSPREIVLVIDHNPALLRRVRQKFPQVLTVENRKERGLSGARSCGIDAARGAILAFLDDDAVAMPGWLAYFARGFEDPAVLTVGGRTEPLWQSDRPRWLPDEFLWVWGCSYRGMPQTTTRVRNTMGGNMAVRREVFDGVGGFRSGLGRVGAAFGGCEETELCIRASQRWPDGIHLYEPRAVIHHRVPDARATWRYFVRRCFGEGRSKAGVSGWVGFRDGLSVERSYASRTLPRGFGLALASAVRHRDVAVAGQAAAIIVGLSAAVAGYLCTTVTRRTGGRARSTPRGALPARAAAGSTTARGWRSAAVMEAELCGPQAGVRAVHPELASNHDWAYLLVRVHGRPLGVVDMALRDGEIDLGAVAAAAWRDLRAPLVAHLERDGVRGVSSAEDLVRADLVPPRCAHDGSDDEPLPLVSVVVATRDRPERLAWTRCSPWTTRASR
jgi:GT2 family glycosyltransferase